MSVTAIRYVPDDLPHAHLYVDDLEDIYEIFKSAFAAKYPDSAATVVFSTDDFRFDSVDDLLDHGGSAKKFRMEVRDSRYLSSWISFHSFLEPSVHFGGLSQDESWALYGRIKAVFENRQYTLKNALFALPRWLTWPVYFAYFIFVPALLHLYPKPLFVIPAISLGAAVGVLVYWPNRVSFIRSRDRWKSRVEFRTGLYRDVLMIVLGGVLGQIIGYLARRFLK